MAEIEQSLREVTELISLPEVYLRVRQLMDDPDSDIYDFAEVVGSDPNLSARLLRLVNSAYFGLPQPVESLSRAVNLVGLAPLHNLVLGVSAVASLELPNDVMPLETFWRSSLFAGVLARLLGEQIGQRQNDHLFVAGLLHEIGHLILYSKFPLQALAARELAETQGKAIHEAEVETLGFHYGDIGAMLMAHWNLPERLQSLTRDHPRPDLAETEQTGAALIHLAHACARKLTTEIPSAADTAFDAEVLAMTGLTQQELETTLGEARSVSADMERVILA